jgi:hypothetical protein
VTDFELAIADHTLEVRRVIGSVGIDWARVISTLRELRLASVAQTFSRTHPTWLSEARVKTLVAELRSTGFHDAAQILAAAAGSCELFELYVVLRPMVTAGGRGELSESG